MKAVLHPVVLVCACVLALAACEDSKAPEAQAPELTTDEQRTGYGLGASMGRQFRGDKLQVDADALVQGVRDGYTADKLSMTDEELAAAMELLQTSHSKRIQAEQEAQAQNNRTAGDSFLAENAKAEGVVTTASGLQYKILTAGDGPVPAAGDTVKVHYRGTLIDGTEFDSSYKRGEPVTFPVQGVIPGWVEALQLMPVGSKWSLYIPSDLAYGPGGAGNVIGPNAALMFEVELLGIEPAEAASQE